MSTVVKTVTSSGMSGNGVVFDNGESNENLIHCSQEVEKSMERI